MVEHMSPDTTTLLPCPFCGASAHMADTGVNWVVCDACGAEGPVADNEQDAIAKWSARAVAATPPNVTDDELFALAAAAWESQTSHPWFTDALEAAVYAVRERLTREVAQAGPDQSFMMQEVLDFLNSIEGAGYGGMAAFEIVRGYAKALAIPSTEGKS